MRSVHLLVPLVTILLALPARAQEAGTTTTTTVPAEVTEKTEVGGNVPATLVGRWLAACQVKLPSGQVRPFARIFEIRKGPEHLELILKRGQLPENINKQIDAATAASKPWEPTPQVLAELDAKWGSLPPIESDHRTIENKLLTPEAYPSELKADDITKDSKLAISINETFTGANRIIRTYTLWGVTDETPAVLTANFITTTIAAAPLPIPITLRGDARLYRLGAAPAASAPSFLERLFGLFSGCGRS